MKRSQFIFPVLLILALGAGVGTYLSDSGPLRETLTLRDGQYGFAGLTGDVLTIQPSGAWTLARFFGDDVEAPHRSGRLDDRQIAELARKLTAQNFTQLPSEFGRDVVVNAHILEIRFGQQTSRLRLNPGERIEDARLSPGNQHAAAWSRFLDLFVQIRSIVDKGETTYIRVEARGTLRADVLETASGSLALRWRDEQQKQDARSLDGQIVTVKGDLRIEQRRGGVPRVIVRVASLAASP